MSFKSISASFRAFFFCSLLLFGFKALAMQPLSDGEMAGAVGQAGLALSLETDGPITASQIEWEMDAANAARAASLILQNISLDWADSADFTFDVATDASDTPYVMLTGNWSDLKARIGGIAHSGAPGHTMGALAINTSGSFLLINEGGPFNSASDSASLNYTSEGDVFWRQRDVAGAPELGLKDFAIGIDIPKGTVGIDDAGIVIAAPEASFDLTFDLSFAPSTTNAYDRSSHDALVHTGWRGDLRNVDFRLAGGGAWHDISGDFYDLTRRGHGLNTDLKLDFGEEFVWVTGQPHQARARAEFSGWQRLGAEAGFNTNGTRVARQGVAMAGYDFRLPLTLDALRGGSEAQWPGGVCFGGATSGGALTSSACGAAGGNYVYLPPDDNTLAMLIRGAGLHAYNTKVEIWEREYSGGIWGPHAKTDEFHWSLLYTFGQLDGNIFMRPEAPGSDVGFRADIVLGFQSPGYWHAALNNFAGMSGDPQTDPRARWATNTHFMIADTEAGEAGFGIGLANADVLWRVEDLAVRLVNPATASSYRLENDVLRHTLSAGVWLETDRKGEGIAAQYNFRGMFGGGDLSNLENLVQGLLLDVNLETDRFVFVLGMNNQGANYVPFEGLFDFNGKAYLSIAEPSVPSAAWRIHNVGGALLWKDGRIELSSGVESPSGQPQLTIANHILLGDTAIQGSVLRGDISLGADDNFGSIAIPSGVVYSSITVRPQSP